MYTFRRHTKAVLSVVVSSNGDNMFSAGLDGQINMWNMPNFETIDQYDAYSPSVYLKSLNEHTDAVWSMILVDNTLVSISADATIRVWNPFGIDELDQANSSSLKCINESKEEGVPTSIDFIHNDKSKIVTSFTNTHHNIYDLETSKVICKLNYSDANTSNLNKTSFRRGPSYLTNILLLLLQTLIAIKCSVSLKFQILVRR